MRRIYWDSMLFIYWVQGHPSYAARIGEMFASTLRQRDRICTSVFTLGETLAVPYREQSEAHIRSISEFFRTPDIEMLPFDAETAHRFARIRGESRVTPADAIHLASAACAGAALFVTNDKRLIGKSIAGIPRIAGLDQELF